MKPFKVSLMLLLVLSFAPMAWATTQWSAQDYDLYTGDFDGDGKADVLYVAKDPSKASGIAKSDGNGPNIPWQSWPSNYLGIPWSGNQYNVIVADFNGDGKADIFLQRTTPGDSYLLITGAAGKVVAISQTVSSGALGLVWTTDQHHIVAGDFNGDGRADLFLQATTQSGLNAVVETDANGQFTTGPAQSWSDGYLGFKWATPEANIYAGDFNGDGKADLLIQAKPRWVEIDFDPSFPVPTYPPNMNGVVFSQSGSSLFTASGIQAWSRLNNGVDWSSLSGTVVIGDFNGDGKADVLLQAKYSSKTSYLLYGSGTGAVFPSSGAVSSNIPVTSDTNHLITGKFGGGAGSGLYFQALTPSGTNYIAISVGTSINATASDPSTGTGTSVASAVGRTVGSFAVANSGAASYSIPVVVPPGVAGIQPSLSIDYSSSAGDGLLGVGWHLSGLSEIERCKKTLATEGVNASPVLQPSDAYCLDGNKLRLTSGTYGADGSTYQTELEQFSQITMHQLGGVSPGYFSVVTKSGLTYEYGKAGGASDNPGGISSNWLLDRVTDRAGNYMIILYSNGGTNGFDIRPNYIQYTANSAAGLAAPYTVFFDWESRPATDIITRLSPNGAMRETYRLHAIRTQYQGNDVRNYQLSYNSSGVNGRSRLTAIQECDGSSHCLSPTTIAWQDGQVGLGSDQTGPNLGSLGAYAMPIDINGDGCADVVYPTTTYWSFMLSNCAGGYLPAQTTSIPHNGNYAKALPIDYNADGKADILVPDANNHWQVLQSTGSGFTVVSTNLTATGAGGTAWAVDINGDGYQDLVFASADHAQLQGYFNSAAGFAATPTVLYTAPSGSTISTTQSAGAANVYTYAVNSVGDFNADGRTDLMLALMVGSTPTPKVLLSTGTGYVDSGYIFSDTLVSGASRVLWSWRSLDVNADGISDIAFVDSTGYWHVLYGTPYGFGGQSAVNSLVYADMSPGYGTYVATDWNGDGKVDILGATFPIGGSYGSWGWVQATGDTLSTNAQGWGAMTGVSRVGVPSGSFGSVNTNITAYNPTITMVADVNGDGLPDLVYVDSSNNWHYLLHNGPAADLVSAVTDGFGNNVALTYAPLTDSSVYTRGTTATFPEMDVQIPLTVVKRYDVSDGIGGIYSVNETYAGLRMHLQGRGVEGFASRTETDSRTGIATTTNFNQGSGTQWVFPFIGVANTVTAQQSNGKTISQVTYHYTDLVTSGTQYSGHYPYADTVTRITYEVNRGDPTDGQGISQVKTVTSVDGYGTPTTVTETAYDLTNNSAVARTVTTSNGTPVNDTANWCLGFITNQTVTNVVPNLAGVTHTTQYVKDSDATKCRVYQKIVEPTDLSPYKVKLTSTYLYDNLGHVNSETVSGAGISDRVTLTSYGSQGVFPLSVTNAEGELVSKSYDYGLGVPLTATDANNVTVTWTYDTFGRKATEIRPDNTSTTWTLYGCGITTAYCGDSLLRYEVQEQQYDATGAPMRYGVQMFDALARIKYAQTQGLTGTLSNVATLYYNTGQVWQKSRPYFSGSAPYYTTYVYDILGRPLSETRQISQVNGGTQSISYGYKRLQHTFTDANTNSTTKQLNALGQVVQVTDALGKSTQYQYDPFGNLLSTTDPAGNQIVNTFNVRGFKTTTSDPDMGNWTYDYYPTGELKSQIDAKSQTASFTYDRVGRPATRTEPEGSTTWTYGNSSTYTTSNRNIGKLISVTSPGAYSESYTYDSLARSQDATTNANSTSYVVSNGYDANSGLLSTVTYPVSTSAVTNSRFKVQYDYAYGALKDIKDYYTPTTVYWQENSTDAAGHGIDDQYGNGLHTYSNYDAITGLISNRTTGATAQVQNLSYQWDKVGNLTERQDYIQGVTEDFTSYDALNRLITSTLKAGTGSPTTNLSITYDSQGLGNIQTKSDVGSYSYAACGTTVHPHAVTSAGTNSYCYDANGNMATRNGSSISWYSYNMPYQINQGSNYSQFFYGAGRARYKQVSYVATGGQLPAGTETTIYVSGLFEQVTKPSGVVEYKHYIMAGNEAIGVRTLRTNSANDTRYLHKDHLGSVDSITDESGNVLQRLSYDAFGKRRSASGWSGSPSSADWLNIAALTHRGFTFHEQLDTVGLVHMNGRVYDPAIGRFISADPSVQAPFIPQNLNRYSYVMNNPLSMIDPSGYSWLSEMWDTITAFVKYFAPFIVSAIVASLTYGATLAFTNSQFLATVAAAAAGGATYGGLGSALNGGNLGDVLRATITGGVIGAATAGVLCGVGQVIGFAQKAYAWQEIRGGVLIADTNPVVLSSTEIQEITVNGWRPWNWWLYRVTDALGSWWHGIHLSYMAAGATAMSDPVLWAMQVRTGQVLAAGAPSTAVTQYLPTNNGFLGHTEDTELPEGTMIDRYGGTDESQFFSPAGTPAVARSLRPETAGQSIRTFQVTRALTVEEGQVAPAFDQIGLGTQYRTTLGLRALIEQGFITEIFPP